MTTGPLTFTIINQPFSDQPADNSSEVYVAGYYPGRDKMRSYHTLRGGEKATLAVGGFDRVVIWGSDDIPRFIIRRDVDDVRRVLQITEHEGSMGVPYSAFFMGPGCGVPMDEEFEGYAGPDMDETYTVMMFAPFPLPRPPLPGDHVTARDPND